MNKSPSHIVRLIMFRLKKRVIRLKPAKPARGNVLISYTTLPFVFPETMGGHSNRWECKRIAETFIERGFNVEVIDAADHAFILNKKYDYFIGIGGNLKRLSSLLGKQCVKIFHITSAHWLFQNKAEYGRLLDIQKRRGATLIPRRVVPASLDIEYADIATILGNDFTIGTYRYAGKPIVRIPVSTTHTYPPPENKNFEKARNNFIWFGGSGMAHKGLDLALEAFAGMPECNLTIFGKKDDDFAEAYERELFRTPNIKYREAVDPGGSEFKDAANNAVGLIYPSCSEGQSGAVILSLHAGLVPIVSYESGVDVENFGIILKENTVDEIKKEVRFIASLPAEKLKKRSLDAWQYANRNHTREKFTEEYSKFADMLITDNYSA